MQFTKATGKMEFSKEKDDLLDIRKKKSERLFLMESGMRTEPGSEERQLLMKNKLKKS